MSSSRVLVGSSSPACRAPSRTAHQLFETALRRLDLDEFPDSVECSLGSDRPERPVAGLGEARELTQGLERPVPRLGQERGVHRAQQRLGQVFHADGGVRQDGALVLVGVSGQGHPGVVLRAVEEVVEGQCAHLIDGRDLSWVIAPGFPQIPRERQRRPSCWNPCRRSM